MSIQAQNKHTPNVRKILQSQKTFSNHLDDFHAMVAHSENNPSSAWNNNSQASKAPGQSAPANSAASTKRGNVQKASASSSRAGRRTSTPATAAPAAAAAVDEPKDVEMADADASAPISSSSAPQHQHQQPRLAPPADDSEPTSYPADGTVLPAYTGAAPPRSHAGDADPLLASRVPPFPTDAELRALLAAPPLSYPEARAQCGDGGDGTPRYPARRFCGVCGYWGRVRCAKCGARVCALDCLDVHREECFTRYGI